MSYLRYAAKTTRLNMNSIWLCKLHRFRKLSSCYGESEKTNPFSHDNLDFSGLCPYLPIKKQIKLNDEIVDVELSSFRHSEVEQGFYLMNAVIKSGDSWPFEVLNMPTPLVK